VNVNTVDPGTITGIQSICSGGDPVAFTNTTPGTGSGTITYRWESSTTDCSSGFSTISGETAATFDPPSGLTQTTYYRRITISTLNSVTNEAASNCLTVTVNPYPDFTLTHPVVCPGDADFVQITGLVNVLTATGSLTVDSGSATSPIPSTITGQTVGSHNATITNAEGCATTKPFTINPTQPQVAIPLTIIRVNR
jgi:hypothetical protein